MNTSLSIPSSPTSLASSLAWELKCRIACYLDPLDAGREIVQTALGIPPIVPLSPARHVGKTIYDNSQSDEPIRAMSLHIPKQDGVETHSVQLQFRWQDQGWGNRKGRLYIVQEENSDRPPNPDARFAGGILLCETQEDAPHEPGNASLLWHPSSPNHKYSLWFKVGGGGGHALYVSNLSLTKYIFDDTNLTYSKTFQRLHELGALRSTVPLPENNNRASFIFPRPTPNVPPPQPRLGLESRFFPRLLLGVCQHFLRTQQQQQQQPSSSSPLSPTQLQSSQPQPQMDPDLVALFREFQLDTTEVSIRAVRDIMNHELMLQDMQEAAAAAEPPRPPPRNVRELLERGGFARAQMMGAGFVVPDEQHHQDAEGIMREVLENLPANMEVPFGAIMGIGMGGRVVFEHVDEMDMDGMFMAHDDDDSDNDD